MQHTRPTIPETLLAGLMKLGITDKEDLKVILLTLKTEDNMAIMIARIEDKVEDKEIMDWNEALRMAILISNS